MQINFTLPQPEIKAKATSSFTLQNIDDRLAKLATMEANEEVQREIAFLTDLRAREVNGGNLSGTV